MGPSLKVVLLSCAAGSWYLYGGLLVLLDVLLSSLPLPLIFPMLLTLLVYGIRLQPPPNYMVESVLGKDLDPEADEDENDETSQQFYLDKVAHRGAGYDAPENSISAFQLAHENGCMAVEFDVALTVDGIPVLFHDKSLLRMCEVDKKINDITWEELSILDISTTHPLSRNYAGEQVPKLEEAIEECLKLDLRVFIDLKDNDTRVLIAVLNMFEKYPDLQARAVITSFYPNLIFWVRRAVPGVVCALSWRPGLIAFEDYTYSRSVGGPYRRRYPVFWQHAVAVVADVIHRWCLFNIYDFLLGISAVIVHKDCLSPDQVRHWRKRGIRAIAWPVNLACEKEYFSRALHVTYLTDTLRE
ncbi:glycerophosphodiester phosphodiesterase 1 [Cloeon dipterum]|uniref:glycerophosphodiester phosphodiesterase 1 n=1 Tax=Cloeon dipterum TaxID=197152 RepID=UPI00321FBB53